MSEINQGQPGAPVSELDQMAEILVGGLDEDSDIQDDGNDENQTEASTEEEVSEDQDAQDDEDVTWAKALGVDESDILLDDDGNFKGIKIVVDGKEEQATLAELKNGYQFNKANTQRAQAIAEERKQLENVKQLVTTEYTQKLQNVNKLTELLAGKFLEEYNSLDWQRIRLEQPGEYAALQRDFDAKRLELQNIFAALETEQKSISVEEQQAQQAKYNSYLEAQAQKAIANNPEWKDVEKFKTAMSDMVKFVGDAYGFSADEFSSVYDARLLELIKDAMAYRNGSKIAQEKIATNIPKFQKSSGPAKKSSKLDQLVKTAKSAKGYKKRDAEADAITALLLQG